MTRESGIARLREARPAWDELSQRRVLSEVHGAYRRKKAGRHRHRLFGGVLFAVAAVCLLAIWGVVELGGERQSGTAGAGTQPESVVTGQSVVALADGSRAILDDGSVVNTQVQRDDLVRLSQPSGRVRYEVTSVPTRAFVVHAGGYEVRVLGTVFAVEATPERLRVEVERGRVEVRRAERTFVLGAGERIDLARRGTPPEPSHVAMPIEPPAVGPTDPRSEVRIPDEPSVPTADRLLHRADVARRAGRLRDAAAALRTLVESHKRDARVPSAWFMLGRVERQRGRHESAARAFRRAWKSGSSRSLIEDARAEEALSWSLAESDRRANEAAKAYLQAYPTGTHRSRVQAIVR